jgi:GNAT superfamily N-acetyltransferase
MDSGISVRIGTPEDLDQVMVMAKMMHDEIGITSLETEKVLPDVWAALNLDRGIMGVIGEPGKTIEGGILLRFGKFFYSNDDVLEERGLFIHPEYRSAKGGRARILCEFAKKAAEDLDMTLFIGVMNDVRTKGKVRLYERQFGEPIGQFFLYRPKPHVEEIKAA